ncbi:phage head-tail connector protein [Paenibacillus elgii]|uniref:phage head-tail connector protein n=1 Tax=Paenibacillus elgii TaxID=189691 RepID=UPI00203DEE5C|nr:phage head-tail connector protein [Paenibacillus elgii]MCM3273665.1 phage head-tail connector protein [Paenibacillus elgii]
METYLNKLKSLLGIALDDPSKDFFLNFALESVIEAIRTYCNIKEMPDGLTNTIVLMARDMYWADHPEEAPIGVENIKRGDVQYALTTDSTGGERFVKNYTQQLNAYRKLRW